MSRLKDDKRTTGEIIDAVLKYCLENDATVEIVSGEGEQGTAEDYSGKLTKSAIKFRLAQERCGGDRWAYVRTSDHATVGF